MARRHIPFTNRTVIIIGGGSTGNALHQFFKINPDKGYTSLGFFDDDAANVVDTNLLLGSTADCITYALTFGIEEVFCTLPDLALERIEQLMLEADQHLIRFRLVPQLTVNSVKPAYIQYFGNIPVIAIRPDPLENRFNRLVKRSFDIIFSLGVIVFIMSWLLPVLAVAVKLSSRGNVFFVQLRSGKANRTFKCYKFRTMLVNTDADRKQATAGDIRITKTGAFLRRTSLDEMPQFFNVLIGNMSVIGPRPHMITHTRQYAQLIDRFMVRHFLKPGISGWAQVNGLRGETTTTDAMLKRVEADVWYLEHWTFWLDVKIIFLTIGNFFRPDKNAF